MPRFFRYAAVGAVATATHYLVLVLCVEGGRWPAFLASGFGAVVGAQVAYVGNRWFTFAHQGEIAASWWRFQSTALVGALFGMIVVALAVRAGWHYVLAQMLATGLALVLTYFINRRWAFGR